MFVMIDEIGEVQETQGQAKVLDDVQVFFACISATSTRSHRTAVFLFGPRQLDSLRH